MFSSQRGMARVVFGDMEKAVYIVPKRALDVDEVKEEMRRVAKRKKQDDEDLDVFTQYGNDTIDCELLDRMLRKFENKTIDMYAYARDTARR